MSELSEALKFYYRMKGVGVRKLSDEWGCSPATVSRLLNGKHVDLETFVRILQCLISEQAQLSNNNNTEEGK